MLCFRKQPNNNFKKLKRFGALLSVLDLYTERKLTTNIGLRVHRQVNVCEQSDLSLAAARNPSINT